MKLKCECFDEKDDGGFDAWTTASVYIKVDKHGKDITSDFSDWDYMVSVDSNPNIWDITCGCCGEETEIC